MPKLFLHVRDELRLILDPDGEHFCDLESARFAAVEMPGS
jgi:hypothetical protein